MRCASYGVLAALLLAAAALCSSALRLESAGVSSVASPLAREKLEQLFIVTASEDPSETVTSISSSSSHQVYVSYSEPPSPGRLATVRVIGDSAQLIQSSVTVSATDDQPGQVHLGSNRVSSITTTAYVSHVRVEIQVHTKEKLQRIETVGSGDIVVEAPELFVSSPRANLVLALSGTGSLYLPPELPLRVQSLQIESTASGGIYVPASDITATDVQVTATGSGDVKIGVSRHLNVASRVAIVSKGSGSCRLVVSDFVSPQLEISISGSGDVIVERVDGYDSSYSGSSVGQCQYSVTGSGELNTAGVMCSNAVVDVSGSGDVTLQAKDSLIYHISSYSSIRYVGPAPQLIISSTGKAKSGAVKPVRNTPKSKPVWMDRYSLPPRRCSFQSGEDYDEDDNDDDEVNAPSHVRGPTPVPDSSKTSISSIHTSSWLPIVIIVVVVFIVWNRVEAWKRKDKRRGEKAPLLGGEAPVYI